MSNNDVMKKLRVALSLRDDDIIAILALVNFRTTKTELSAIFRSEDHPNFAPCKDQLLRNFLNGLVIYKRGPMPDNRDKNKQQGQGKPKPEGAAKPIENKSNEGKA